MKVYITRKITATAKNMLQKAGFKVEMFPYSDRIIPRKLLLQKIKGCDAVLSLLTEKVDEEFFKAAGPQLKVVANYAVGFDNINLEAAKKHNVKVGNTPCEEVNEAVSEAALTMMLACATRIVSADHFVRTGKYKVWDPTIFVGPILKNKVLGIVGSGRIGGGLAQRAKDGFGLKLVYTDVKRNMDFEKKYNAKFMSLDKLLKVSDFVSLHVPLLKSTWHLISTKQLNLMKKNAYLINTARGPVVDEKALIKAVKAGKIAGAALDVYECEPSIDCDLSDNLSLLQLGDKIVMTPHTASATIEAREKMAELAAGNVIAVLKGRKMPAEVVIK